MDTRKSIFTRMYLLYGFLFLLSLAVVARILYIQLAEGDKWKEKAKKLSLKYLNIEANRGNIFDMNGTLLATSIPFFEVRMDAASPQIPDSVFRNEVDSLASRLSAFFKDQSKTFYKTRLVKAREDTNRYLLLKRNVSFDQLKTLQSFPIFRRGKNSGGLIAIPRNKRVYPYMNLAYRTIGWFKEDNPNNVGIEAAFNNDLRGNEGKRLYQRIPDGNWRPMNRSNEIEPQDGYDILTTLDINLQDVAEEALMQQLEANQADHGCAVLMEVKTGEIRAIANLGKNKDGHYEELYNYAIGESTEPGSTFKMFSLLAALEDKKVQISDMVDVTGGITKYANRIMKDSHLGESILTVQQAFDKSSNVGISKVIYQHYAGNPQAFINRLYSFGVQKKAGLEIPGEGRPNIKDTKNKYWSKVSLPWMSIGYEVELTPLQILTFYNAIANDGVMVKPHFVKEIRKDGIPVKTVTPEIINPKIASKDALATARYLLESVVEHGTGSALKNPVYKVAGKTGTAQVAQKSKGYNKNDYKGSFVGYFPADNPKYSCIVVINNPKQGGYYGGAIAAPVFREIADRIYATDPDVGENWSDSCLAVRSNPLQAGDAAAINYLSRWLSYNSPTTFTRGWLTRSCDTSGKVIFRNVSQVINMPNVVGMGASDATYMLEKQGIKVQLSGLGLVQQQSLSPGSAILPGMKVHLSLGL